MQEARAEATESSTLPADPLIGRTLAGKYRLDALLGEGGMGGVYRARQVALDKAVAVKVMHEHLASDPLFVARFHREARATSRLDHANSVRVLDFGEEPDGVLYLAMELLDGKSLFTVIEEEGPLPLPRIVNIVSQALSALVAAHQAGIIHRDLKPENIMLRRRKGEDGHDEELVKILDFGIAQMAEAPEESDAPARAKRGKLTVAGLAIGTPDYMSPEQARGETLDARSDVYSMGVMLYLLLSDRTPFDGPTAMSIVLMHQNQEPLPPSAIRPDVDPRLEAVCLRAMRKRPEERWASAREMRAALRAAIDPASPLSNAPRLRGKAHIYDPTADTALYPSSATGAEPPAEPGATTTPEPAPAPVRRRRRAPIAALGIAALVACLYGARWLRGATTATPNALVHEPATQGPLPTTESPRVSSDEPSPAPRPLPVESLSSGPAPVAPLPPRTSRLESTKRRGSLSGQAQPAKAPGATAAVPEVAESAAPVPPREVVPPAPVATSPAFDPSSARVTAGNVKVLFGGLHPSEVDGIVRASMGRINSCYREGAAATSPEGTWNLIVATDDEGNVQPARLDGPLSPKVKDCISGAPRGRVHADTGPGSAKIPLTFSLR